MQNPKFETAPIFANNVSGFLAFLRIDEESTIISPRRFSLALSIDVRTLAADAAIHQNTILHAPASESVQRHLRDSLRIIRASIDISGHVEKSIFWYKNSHIPLFDYMTAQTLVSKGRTDDLMRYLQSLDIGFTG
ncbi:DUF2384 domain-containing protein [Herbaspirillum sp. LeCh32-8]|uniref:DUF2384 domain-containing protein n=1 Tax=Herbaspirillum sp. LeCh32-8 TaxID=2821356 RepID=UPI001AE63A3A|nr:DUF2384 domain-containing protein [Herbaspirillum sp. LeCh32-8]MBP0598878.1 DUF2384 domain-containing protein [Herbaspirillum sp. LeCh32-8]